jgi:hypothetical protein
MRIWWEHTLLLWKALSSFALSLSAMIVVIVVTTLLIQGLIRRTVAIEPISVPKELADKGYIPEVAARRLRDAVHTFVTKSETSMKGPEIALHGDVPDIVVPTVGISIDSITKAMRGFLQSNRHRSISGEFTIADGLLWLRLRLDGVSTTRPLLNTAGPSNSTQSWRNPTTASAAFSMTRASPTKLLPNIV